MKKDDYEYSTFLDVRSSDMNSLLVSRLPFRLAFAECIFPLNVINNTIRHLQELLRGLF